MSAARTPAVDARRERRAAGAEWVYRLLLRAYPLTFRAEYGREMTQLFRDQCPMRETSSIGFWMHVVWDVAQSAPALRIEAWRARGREETRTLEGIMKLIAMLAALLGVFGALNAVAEAVAGTRQGFGGTYLLSVILGAVAGALLVVAAVAALRGTSTGRRTATGAAIASLMLFLVARGMLGWMSIFAQLVGIVLPLVILAALHWPRATQRRSLTGTEGA